MEEQKAAPISEYNTAALINQRLHNLWLQANELSIKQNLYKWNLCLDALWRELVGDLDDDDYTKWLEDFNKIEKKFKNGISNNDGSNGGFKKPTSEKIKNFNLSYQILVEKHIFLKKLEKTLGKGTKFRDDVDDYMDS